MSAMLSPKSKSFPFPVWTNLIPRLTFDCRNHFGSSSKVTYSSPSRTVGPIILAPFFSLFNTTALSLHWETWGEVTVVSVSRNYDDSFSKPIEHFKDNQLLSTIMCENSKLKLDCQWWQKIAVTAAVDQFYKRNVKESVHYTIMQPYF